MLPLKCLTSTKSWYGSHSKSWSSSRADDDYDYWHYSVDSSCFLLFASSIISCDNFSVKFHFSESVVREVQHFLQNRARKNPEETMTLVIYCVAHISCESEVIDSSHGGYHLTLCFTTPVLVFQKNEFVFFPKPWKKNSFLCGRLKRFHKLSTETALC